MITNPRSAATAAFLLVLAAGPPPAVAQQSSGDPPRQTAEELHAARRLWLEQQRLGDSAAVWTPNRGVRGPQPGVGGGDRRGPLGQPVAPYGGYGGYGGAPPAYAPLGHSPFELSGWCAIRLGSGPVPYAPYGAPSPYGGYGNWGAPGGLYGAPAPYGPYGPAGSYGGYPPYGAAPLALNASCLLGSPYGGAPVRDGWSRGSRRYDPAYPPVNRFHSRFFGDEQRAAYPEYGAGMHMLPPDPWRAPPWYWGVAPRACAQVLVSGLAGEALLQVGLPVLGARTAEELELAIDARLSAGQPVQLHALDGRMLRLAAGVELERLTVTPCDGGEWR